MCQNCLWSRTWERLDLPSSHFVPTSILGSRETLLILGSKVKVTRVKCAKTVPDCLSNEFPNWISSSNICAIHLYKTSATKKALEGIMFYKHLLFILAAHLISSLWKLTFSFTMYKVLYFWSSCITLILTYNSDHWNRV